MEKDQDSSYSGRDHSMMFIPGSTYRPLTGQRYINLFIFKAASPDLNAALTREVTAALGARKRFDPTDTQAVQVWDTTEMFVFFDAFMLGFNVFLGLMGVLTLSSAHRRLQHHECRRRGTNPGDWHQMALGARSRAILSQFMLETMVLTGVGGATGLAISYSLCSIFPTSAS